jgi:hypothetical protein
MCSVAWFSGVSAFGDTPNSGYSEAKAATTNFVVRSYPGGPPSGDVHAFCEKLRTELVQLWNRSAMDDEWRPQCEIVLHAKKASYLRAVGNGGGQTAGSSMIRTANHRVVARRIDLLVGPDGDLPALAHELTHIVLADRFAGRQPPRWLDEGIAMLADPAEKRVLHRRDFRVAIQNNTALQIGELIGLQQFTSQKQVAAFYGQSLSLVQFLAQQDEPRKIVEFAELAMDQGYDAALLNCYGINGITDLEQRWREYALSTDSARPLPDVVTVGFRPRTNQVTNEN